MQRYTGSTMFLPAAAPTPSNLYDGAWIDRATSAFAERFSDEAEVVVFAPGRVNVIGEHTDYNDGFVLPMAIEKGIYVAARPREDKMVRIWSEQMPESLVEFSIREGCEKGDPAWCNYIRGVIAGFQERGIELAGFDAAIVASLPHGGGLSSSAALEVSFATLFEAFAGHQIDPVEKALLCQAAEHRFAGTPCGIMDQFAVIFGVKGRLLLIDCRTLERRLTPVALDETTFLVINTMVRHELTDGGYASRRKDCFDAAEMLGVPALRDVNPAAIEAARGILTPRLYRRARHITTENERTLAAVDAINRKAWIEVGSLMYASHASLRDDFEVSCEELDIVVDISRQIGAEAGVYGCRMTGGGFGGCCVALVRADVSERLGEQIGAEYARRTGIYPVVFASRPADGPAVLLRK